MEIDKMLKHVNDLNEYINISQKVLSMPANTKFHFNMSTVLSLKKVRALEIEYFNKCEGRGAALLLLERIIELPPCKTWLLCGRELASLLQYWLDAMRKNLVKHNHNWWNFLKYLLKFIKLIRVKDPVLPNILLEYTAECLLDLATGSEPDVQQRLEILICLNLSCELSSREIRISLREKLDNYLTKLSTLLANCGHWPSQYSILENLMRWLVPRHDPVLRQTAVDKWLPVQVFGEKAIGVFLERAWQNFYQDARDFLNAYNEKSNCVISVVCRKAAVGNIVLVSGTENRLSWLDINCGDKSISIAVSPKVIEALGHKQETLENLLLPNEITQHVQISKESLELILTVELSHPARSVPTGIEFGIILSVVISSHQLKRMNRALRDNYLQRYQLLLDLNENQHNLSPQATLEKTSRCTDEDTRFSHPIEIQKNKRFGYIVRSDNPAVLKSPSSVSTSSLVQLHEKLAQLPRFDFEKEAVHVCALPQLSTVIEVSETDAQNISTASTIKLNRPHGLCRKKAKKEKKSQRDTEIYNKPKVGRYLSPVDKIDENSTTCLLVATIGSDESVINETLERLSKTKDFQGDNLVNLIVQEALQSDYQEKDKLLDSGINTGDNKKTPEPEVNSEAIENTPVEKEIKKSEHKSKQEDKFCTVISNTTTDESNDVVYDTPQNFVNVRRRQRRIEEKVVVMNEKERPVFDVQEIEKFFTQHLNENQRGKVVISPTLARKINETSSESDHFEECLLNENDDLNVAQTYIRDLNNDLHEKEKDTQVDRNVVNVNEKEIPDLDVIECLNFMVDKVCNDLKKCNEMLDRDIKNLEILDVADVQLDPKRDTPLKDTTNIGRATPADNEKVIPNSVTTPKRVIKLKYPTKKPVKMRSRRKNKKMESKSVKVPSPIAEAKSPTDDVPERDKTPSTSPVNKSDLDLPIARRKRKLYSPKDNNVEHRQIKMISEKDEDNDFKASKVKTPKNKATSYKDIEEDRKKIIRKPRSKKSGSKSENSPSPRTKKMNDMFNNLKDKVESNNSVILADKKQLNDLAIYNFTSDSEDEDFKKKKFEMQKRIRSTTIASGDSTMSTRHGRQVSKVNYSENKCSNEAKKPVKPVKQKRTRRKMQTRAQQIKQEKYLEDEKMRKSAKVSEELNTSLVIEKPVQKPTEEPILVIAENPVMEAAPDVVEEHTDINKKSKKTKKDVLSLKKEKPYKPSNYKPLQIIRDDDGSPLPGLLIEAFENKQDEAKNSISTNILQKLQKINQETSVNDTNTTQNLLSDVERSNYSPPVMNITEQYNKIETEAVIEINEISIKNLSKSKCNFDDNIIDLESEYQKSKTKRNESFKSVKKNSVEDIELVEISEDSMKSIATVGKSPITGHGDINEAPPYTELLTQDFDHRDIRMEDLDQSIKDYFYKLREETTSKPKTNRKSDSSDETRVISKRSSLKEKSPVVSITRLSLNDISKWLPSRRNSDTDSSYYEAETVKSQRKIQNSSHTTDKRDIANPRITKAIVENIDDIMLKVNTKDNERSKLPSQILQYKINEGFDSGPPSTDIKISKIKARSYKILENAQEKNKIHDQKERIRYQKKSESENANSDYTDMKNSKIKTRSYKILEKTQEKNNYQKERIRYQKKSDPENARSDSPERENTPKKTKKNDASQNRKSMISPIKLFTDMFPTIRQESSEEESSIMHELKASTPKKESKQKIKVKNPRENAEVIEVSSSVSKISTSFRIKDENRLKRKSDSPLKEYVKRRKLEKTEVILSESDRSMSSVNEWFRKITPLDRAESINTSLTETINNVMEKLDTTLSEIHQNTSNRFIHMFVNAQKHLATVKHERRQMYRKVASEVLADVVKVIDAKFADLDQRSQEMDAEFMSNLKSQALEFIREDVNKKQVMVSLLKEDIQAVVDHLAKRKDNDFYNLRH